MTRRLLIFAAGCLLAWGLLVGPAWLLGGQRGSVNASIAASLCMLPALLTLILAEKLSGGNPTTQAGIMLAGSVLRTCLVLGGAAILVKVFPQLVAEGDLLFWGWVILFYLITLAWEVLLVAGHRLAVFPPATPPAKDAPAR